MMNHWDSGFVITMYNRFMNHRKDRFMITMKHWRSRFMIIMKHWSCRFMITMKNWLVNGMKGWV